MPINEPASLWSRVPMRGRYSVATFGSTVCGRNQKPGGVVTGRSPETTEVAAGAVSATPAKGTSSAVVRPVHLPLAECAADSVDSNVYSTAPSSCSLK